MKTGFSDWARPEATEVKGCHAWKLENNQGFQDSMIHLPLRRRPNLWMGLSSVYKLTPLPSLQKEKKTKNKNKTNVREREQRDMHRESRQGAEKFWKRRNYLPFSLRLFTQIIFNDCPETRGRHTNPSLITAWRGFNQWSAAPVDISRACCLPFLALYICGRDPAVSAAHSTQLVTSRQALSLEFTTMQHVIEYN